jgi:calcineurin-like phosphoesterase family protein
MMRWFISDTHFGHKKILKYQAATRTFESAEAMDEHMISVWNKHIKPKDLVYVVGDFSFYRDMTINQNILTRLNGKKILIRGNHDIGETTEYLAAGFADVRDELIMKLSNAQSVLVKHYPYDSPWWIRLWLRLTGKLGGWKKYYALYPIDKGLWHIHGHHHGAPRVSGRQINVNVDSWDFKPVSETTICQIMRGKQ